MDRCIYVIIAVLLSPFAGNAMAQTSVAVGIDASETAIGTVDASHMMTINLTPNSGTALAFSGRVGD